MGGNGNGNESMGVGREWEQESHFRTPPNHIDTNHSNYAFFVLRVHQTLHGSAELLKIVRKSVGNDTFAGAAMEKPVS